MTTRYPGGLIRKTPPTITPPTNGEGGSAPGVWTLEQASYYTKQGTWPKPLIERQLYSTGNNTYGLLGSSLPSATNRSSPVQIGSETYWTKIDAGAQGMSAITNTNQLFLWGRNNYGQLGDGTRVYRSSPVQIGALTNWAISSVGFQHAAAVKTDGSLWSWGSNLYGQLGQNISYQTHRSSPVQVGALTTWSTVSCGNYFTIALQTNGTLWAWGDNPQGQLGDGTITKRSSPVQIGALTSWLSISAGAAQCIAIQNNGSMWSWGANNYGQLGLNINYQAPRSSPSQIGSLTTWAKAQTGNRVSLAIKTDGTLWAFGQNNQGQLGTGYPTDRSSPVQVGAQTYWSNVTVSADGGSCFGITTDQKLFAWGKNDYGQLGLNDASQKDSPNQVGSLSKWVSAAATENATVFIRVA